jgi:hypothetical protein
MESGPTSLDLRAGSIPRLFASAGRPRALWILAAITLASGAAMLPAMSTMAGHGASLFAFEGAGSVARSREILSGWGAPGKTAAWWQLALDTPFLIGYGLFAAGACAAVARRAAKAGKSRLLSLATALVWCGPIAAAADLLQNVSLALILSGHVAQPWPRIAAICGPTTTILMIFALAFALIGAVATREPRPVDVPGTTGLDG